MLNVILDSNQQHNCARHELYKNIAEVWPMVGSYSKDCLWPWIFKRARSCQGQ